jgi:ferredoxin-NADP reductase
MSATLQGIIRYPIKGFSGQEIQSAHLLKNEGLPFDRRLAFTNGLQDVAPDGGWTPCGAFIRLTKNITLPRYGVAFDDTAETVTVTHPDGQTARFALDDAASLADANHRVAEWFPQTRNRGPLSWTRAGLGYWDHDDATLSIINLDSVEQLGALAGVDIDPRRFRGNLNIKGGGAWSEFDLIGRQLRIGQAIVEILRPIDRCSATSVHPDRGEIDLNLPASLARHAGHIFCGIYARVIKSGVIRPGDSVEPIGRSSGVTKAASERPTAPGTAQWPRSGRITAVQQESESIRSFWISDRLADDAIIPPYVPGQHIRLHGIGPDRSSWRSYTISGRRSDGQVRISVKRDLKGACSGWLHDNLKVGDSLTISGPFGSFVQPPAIDRQITMLSAGIGITPLLAMLSGLAADAPEAVVRFVHVCRSMRELALWDEVAALKARMCNLVVQLYIDMAGSEDVLPPDAIRDRIGWDEEVVRASASNAINYLCGPRSFMQTAREHLQRAGIHDQDILEEIFTSPANASGPPRLAPALGPFPVHFAKSGITIDWIIASGSLLDLAEAAGVTLPANCRGGACGVCAQTVQLGEVAYLIDPVSAPDGRRRLLCCAVPLGEIVIDA